MTSSDSKPACVAPEQLKQAIHRWMRALHALEILPPAVVDEPLEPLRARLRVQRECFDRQEEMLSALDPEHPELWRPHLPGELSDVIIEEFGRFTQLQRPSAHPLPAAPVVLSFALWNDAPGPMLQPATHSEGLTALWEQVQAEFDVMRARILRESRLMAPAVANTLDVELLPPLDLAAIEGDEGWPPGSFDKWTEDDVFARSPPHEGDWLRAGLLIVRIKAPDYPTFAWIENLVLEHWRALSNRLATSRSSFGISPDLETASLSASFLRWELLVREVDSILAHPGLSEGATTLLEVERNADGHPVLVKAITELPPDAEDEEPRQIPAYCRVDDEEGLAAAIAPWLLIYRPGYLLHIQQFPSDDADSAEQSSGLPASWFDATPPSRLH